MGQSGNFTVSVTMRPQGTRFRSEQQSQATTLAKRAQAILSDPSKQNPEGLASLSLRNEHNGTATSWNPANETDTLRNFREQMEKAARAQFVVSFSYLLSGRRAKTPSDATLLYKAGLQLVGTSYRDHSVQDDTGLKLIAAQSLERTQGPEAAAPMLGRVLENRLAVWARRDHISMVSEVR